MRILLFALFVFSVSLNAGEPEGDQHVAALPQEFDTLTTTYTLFARMVEEQRPVEVVAHSLDILADEFDQFYARLSQFPMRLKVAPNVNQEFTDLGRAQLDNLLSAHCRNHRSLPH